MQLGLSLLCRPALLMLILIVGCGRGSNDPDPTVPPSVAGPIRVQPGDRLQSALDRAAAATKDRRLILKPGVYHSPERRFCLLALTARHEGVHIEGQPGTVLSARAQHDQKQTAVSHVIYCGDGLSSATVVKGLTITGATGLVTEAGVPQEDFSSRARVLKRGLFYFMDGGALKVFGQSSPTFESIVFRDNETQLCGGAVSVEQQGFFQSPVAFRNCRFIDNRCPGTGSAVDVLEGSAAKLENCLFVGNIANYGMTEIAGQYGLTYNAKHGCGALTVFPGSFAWASHCTFVSNWNGVDDRGTASRYEDCIFAFNDASDGSRPGHPYELDIKHAGGVTGCFFHTQHADLQGTISPDRNFLQAANPLFDDSYVPMNPQYRDAGFRPEIPAGP